MLNTAKKQMAIIGWRNVIRNWRHSLASSLAILAGFAAISIFDGFLTDLKRVNVEGYSKRGMQGDVLIQRKDAQYKLIEDSFAYAMTKNEQDIVESIIRSDPDFDLRVRFLEVKGMIANGAHNAIILGGSMDVEDGAKMRGRIWEWNTVAGVPLSPSTQMDTILVGTALGKMMGCEASVDIVNVMRRTGGYIPEERSFKCARPTLQLSATTEFAQINALDVKVIGIVDAGFREADKHWVNMSLPMAQKLLDTNKVTTISVRLKNSKHIPDFIHRVKTKLRDHGLDLDIMPWQEHQVGTLMRGSLQILNTFRNLFMVIVVTICVLSVANTMMKSVSERTREIGVLRSFGFLQKDIGWMFLFEGLFLSILSCFFGTVLTLILSFMVNYSGLTYKAGILSAPIYLTVAFDPFIWLLNATWLTCLAAGTAWFCARRAARMVIADALRHV